MIKDKPILSKDDSLAKASKSLMLKEPFYGLFLIMLNKRWEESIGTAGVMKDGINFKLIINEHFWTALSQNHQRGLLKHELLHIVFFHLLIDRSRYSDDDVRALAVDLEVNQYIDPADLPPGAILRNLYPELKLKEKEGFRYYYEELMKAKEDNSCPNLTSQLQAMEAERNPKVILVGPNGENLPDHSMWKDMEGLTETEKKLLQKQIDYQLKEVAESIQKSRGTIPSELSGYIQRLSQTEPPKFDWRGYLRRFAGGSTKIYTKKLRRKFNKRFEANPGLKIKPKKHIMVAVDTSGSVSDGELQEFFHEIDHIHRTGAEVTIVQADAAISSIKPYTKANAEIEITGRGGTSFQPVIDYYNDNLHKYTCLVYFTDGEAPAPDRPLGKLLWVLSARSRQTDHLPGQTIQLN